MSPKRPTTATKRPAAMPRLRISAVMVVGLLAFPPSAHADCAWVMWIKEAAGGWSVMATSAMSTREECIRTVDAKEKQMRAFRAALKEPAASFADPSYVCLPDTVDPRAPKGR